MDSRTFKRSVSQGKNLNDFLFYVKGFKRQKSLKLVDEENKTKQKNTPLIVLNPSTMIMNIL